MPKFFVQNNQVKNEKINIIGEDVNHIKNVLRAKIEEELNICNIETKENYIAKIEEIKEKEIILKITEKTKGEAESNIKLDIFQGIPKSDKMELIIQKTIELGVNKITPVEMKRCVVKLKEKDKQKKIERWQKIAIGAAKQSGRDIIPKIEEIINIKNICNLILNYDIVLIAYENEKQNTLKNELKNIKDTKKENLKIACIIGPEGGIDKEEIEILENKGAKVITLGNRILRTETAPITITSIIMYEFE